MAEGEMGGPAHDRRERSDPPSWRPIPDPTSLTTQALEREVAVLREIIEQQIGALCDLTEVQFTGVRKEIGEQRRYYDTLLAEKDSRYTERFEAAQKAIDNAARSVREALEAALAATKESVGKAEVSYLKQADTTYVKIDALQLAMSKVIPREESERAWGEIDRRLSDHDQRLTTQEATRQGKAETTTDMRAWLVALVMFISLAVAITVAFAAERGGP